MIFSIYTKHLCSKGFHLGYPLASSRNLPSPEEVLDGYNGLKHRRKPWKRFDWRYSTHLAMQLGHQVEGYQPFEPSWKVTNLNYSSMPIDVSIELLPMATWVKSRKGWKHRTEEWAKCAINSMGGEYEV